MKQIKHRVIRVRNPETGIFEDLPALRGESAYEAAVRLGKTTLTESEWVQAMSDAGKYAEKSGYADKAGDASTVRGIDVIQPLDQLAEADAALSRQITQMETDLLGRVCPPLEAGGSVVQCNPVADSLLTVTSEIAAVQSETPSPENSQPISGWDTVRLYRAASYDESAHAAFTAVLPETVYGGTLDWTTGLLTVTAAMKVLTGSETALGKYSGYSDGNVYQIRFSDYLAHSALGFCTHYALADSYRTLNTIYFGNSININAAQETTTEFRAFLAAEYAAGTPVKIVYRIAAPYTIQLAPQQIRALSGVNTLWSSTGDTQVTGFSDPIYLTRSILERLEALEA